jgi:hypothetical protein
MTLLIVGITVAARGCQAEALHIPLELRAM